MAERPFASSFRAFTIWLSVNFDLFIDLLNLGFFALLKSVLFLGILTFQDEFFNIYKNEQSTIREV
jgi:hypothetical protein